MVSRNKREGKYCGTYNGKHLRTKSANLIKNSPPKADLAWIEIHARYN